MSSGLINSRTLIPPVPVGKGMSDEEWARVFPGGIRKNWETEEEYEARASKDPGRIHLYGVDSELFGKTPRGKKLADMTVADLPAMSLRPSTPEDFTMPEDDGYTPVKSVGVFKECGLQ